LAQQSDSTYRIKDDVDRMGQNAIFIKNLVQALKISHSFDFDFDSLKNVSVLTPSNKSFRIFTWFIPFNDGTYKYYGTIQQNSNDGKLQLIPLFDGTAELASDNLITDSKQWFGARYFNLITVSATNQRNYYLLLGWKGNNSKTNKKVIEVLSFENNKAIFGKPVLETSDKKGLLNRRVFEYNKQNVMTLLYDKASNQIVFDHLAPLEADKKDNPEFFVSDGTFDGYLIYHSKLRYQTNIPLKNAITNHEADFINPTKASELLKKAK
jgi:hypothetical protein